MPRQARTAVLAGMARRILCLMGCLLLTGVAAKADQYDPRLNDLFVRLAAAPDPRQARHIGFVIRDIWRIYNGDGFDVVEFFNRAGRAAARGEDHLAEIAYGGVIQQAPNFAEGWHQRGRQRYRLGDIDGAIADLKFALGLEPRHFDALAALGQCYLAQAEPEQALAAFEAALELHPYLPIAAERADDLRRALGDPI